MSHEPRELDPLAPDASIEEQLVAYLDGELNADESARIERLVAADPKARETLARLERTWSLLDELDQTTLDDSFTHTTLEMVAVAAEEDVQRQRAEAPRRRLRRWLVGMASLLGAALAAFLIVLAVRPDPNRQLLEDLPVLEDLDALCQIDNVCQDDNLEFLRLLAGLFESQPASDAPDWAAASRAERQVRLEALSPAEKAELLDHKSRFDQFTPEKQQRLRSFNQHLEQDEHGAELRRAMRSYYEWRVTRPPYESLQLAGIKQPEDRVAEIKKVLQEQQQGQRNRSRVGPEGSRRFGNRGGGMTPRDMQDMEAVLEWIAQHIANPAGPLFASLRPETRDELRKATDPAHPDPLRRNEIVGMIWLRWRLDHRDGTPPILESELNSLYAKLSPEAIQRLAAKPRDEQWRTISAMVLGYMLLREYAPRRGDGPLPLGSNEELAEFFETELKPEERDLLMSFPGDGFQRQLWRFYARRKWPDLMPPPPKETPGRGWSGKVPPPRNLPRTGKSGPPAGP